MKILSNKKYGVLVGEIERLNENIKAKNNYAYELLEKNQKLESLSKNLKEENEEYKELNELLESKLHKLENKYKLCYGAKGGMTKYLNKITKQLEEVKKELEETKLKLEESMTDKYLVRKVRGSGTKKQTMQIKSSNVQSKIIKNVKEN